MRWLFDLPLIVILLGLGALSMLVPAAHAAALGDERTARVFLYGAVLFSILSVLLGLAAQTLRPRQVARSQLLSLLGAYLLLPLMFAVPMREALGATTFLNAWFEMLSCLTTTGATVYDDAARLNPTLHLWRGLVGWLGGLLTWVVAVALLAPMNLGGFEVQSAERVGRGAALGGAGFRRHESGQRLLAAARLLFPIYLGLTLLLWLLLILSGSGATDALIHAMSTLSTSGVTSTGGVAGSGAGLPGEIAVAAFLVFALSRMTYTDVFQQGYGRRLVSDHELRLGLLIVTVVPALLFLRHWIGAAEVGEEAALGLALRALWGAVFMVMSFLTTTGFVSAEWEAAQGWSGLGTPGTLLVGLAVLGGGVGTTAGGVKLLRVWALYTHSEREVEKLIYPSSVGGAGQAARRLRREGAEVAWIFFMLYALSIAIVSSAYALAGLDFETSMVLTVAALSTTGPLTQVGAEAPILMSALGELAKGITMAAMIVGRLETLALIALLNPQFWRN